MNLQTKSLKALFWITLLLTLITPALFPSYRLLFFAPFIITSYYQKPRPIALWYSFGVGLILDPFLSQERFGLHTLCFTITSAMLYSQKRSFFADYLTTLPIMVFLFSSGSTLVRLFLMHGLEKDLALTWMWAFTDIIAMPAMDALYAFCFFILPSALFGKKQRRGKDYFVTAGE